MAKGSLAFIPFYSVNKVKPDTQLWQTVDSTIHFDLFEVRFILLHQNDIDQSVVLETSAHADVVGNRVSRLSKTRHPADFVRRSFICSVHGRKVVFEVKRTPPGGVG